MKHKVTYSVDGINNFHNRGDITIIADDSIIVRDYRDRDCYVITRTQAQRVQRHFCGIYDCHCAAGGLVSQLDETGTRWGVPTIGQGGD